MVGQAGFFSLGKETNEELKPSLFRFKIDLVSHPAWDEGVG